VRGDFVGRIQFGQDFFGQLFAEFDAPLVEAEDIP